MLTRLVATELRLKARTILAGAVVLFMGPLFAALMGAQMGVGLLPSLACFAAWEYCRRTVYDEDLSGAWTFQRSLPLAPGQIVSVRYVASVLVLLVYGLVALAIAVAVPPLRCAVMPGAWSVAIAMSLGIGLMLIALCNWTYYRHGYATIAAGLLSLAVPLAAVFLIIASPLGRSQAVVALLRKVTQAGQWLAAHPTPGLMIWVGAACLVLVASWLNAIASFSRREF